MKKHLLSAKQSSALLTLLLLVGAYPASAETVDSSEQDYQEASELALTLAELDLEQLVQMKVTSVSKKEQRLGDAAAAIFVVTNEDIRRSGATNIPESLRLVPGLHVARIDSNKWAITARGFNDLFANKLLVLVDGRTVYTPLFSGVFWDTQDVMLEDVDRIEVIRGPGATLWGANAVNGVINIITKSANDTQGGLATAGGGTEELGFGSVRYGAAVGDSTAYRTFAKYNARDNFKTPAGGKAEDDWESVSAGFRVDSEISERDSLTVQGDGHYVEEAFRASIPILTPPLSETLDGDRFHSGANALVRWNRTLEGDSDLQLQSYFDYSQRDDVVLDQSRRTFDVELQHRFTPVKRHELIWGTGYRTYRDHLKESDVLFYDPSKRTVDLITGFIQDEITVIEDRFRVTVGTKLEHNDHTNFEIQPSVRAIWTPDEQQSIWGAVSRAVRTPSRTNDDIRLNLAASPTPLGIPALAVLTGNQDVDSEKVISYELGYRAQLSKRLSVDIAAFYSRYDDLVGGERKEPIPQFGSVPPYLLIPVTYEDGIQANTYGAELSVEWRAKDWWKLVATYSYIDMHFSSGNLQDVIAIGTSTKTPDNQALIRSLIDLPYGLEFDSALRFVDAVPFFGIDSYTELDLRLGWLPCENLEVAIVGQNLLDNQHQEYVSTFILTEPVEIPRGVYGKVTWRF